MDLTTWLLAAALSLLIGITLGLLGGGGSILTVPVLVYLLGMPAKEAIATSLLVVAVTSLVAVVQHARRGRVCWKVGFLFSLSGMAGAFLGGRGAEFIPGALLLLLFAAIMLATASAMLRGAGDCAAQGELPEEEPGCPPKMGLREIFHTLIHGLVVGGVSGLVGAGGGFLIVPALHLLGGLPMRAAVGTSLMVIALNSFAALSGYLLHLKIDLLLAGIVTGGAILGSYVGTSLARFLNPCHLRKLFGWFVITMALFMFFKQLETLIALWNYLVALASCIWHCIKQVPFPRI